MKIDKDISLAPLTSWLIGGDAEFFCQPTSEAELEEALLWADQHNADLSVLGGGSNVLISDFGVKGLVVSLKKFSQLKYNVIGDELRISCWSGTSKSELLKLFLKFKLAPALFLAGLPGDVGGGVVMNAGVSELVEPREFGQLVRSVEVWSTLNSKLVKSTFRHEQIEWSYRHSKGWGPGVIAKVELATKNKEEDQILEKVKNANRVRLQKQPLDMPSCGSVFVNPPGHKAAQLIESCQLKGMRRGQAQVSIKHANFIVNLGAATAIDTWNLILDVQKTVYEKTKVKLQTEVVRMGSWE